VIFDRIVGVVWLLAGLFIAGLAGRMALSPPADWTGWAAAAGMAGVAVYALRTAHIEFKRPAPPPARALPHVSRAPETPEPFLGERIPLETQIENLAAAGLALNPGVTIEDLLHSFNRETYETEPYDAILFMYCSEIERQPWGRAFTSAGWNFDTECLDAKGSYVHVMRHVVNLTGQPGLVSALSDDFDFDAPDCRIKYAINGVPRTLVARVRDDWADVEALLPFFRDLEQALADGRRFWAGDNGQSILVFLITDLTAGRINALKANTLTRLGSLD
jgi:hypothetical protein